MFFSHYQLPTAHHLGLTVVARPGPRVLEGMIAAAAEMAHADGHVEAIEHQALLSFLRRTDALVLLGRGTVTKRFATALSHIATRGTSDVSTDDPDEWQDLADRLRPLADMESARLVAGAAAFVAAADGMVHPRELRLLRALRVTLGIVPKVDHHSTAEHRA